MNMVSLLLYVLESAVLVVGVVLAVLGRARRRAGAGLAVVGFVLAAIGVVGGVVLTELRVYTAAIGLGELVTQLIYLPFTLLNLAGIGLVVLAAYRASRAEAGAPLAPAPPMPPGAGPVPPAGQPGYPQPGLPQHPGYPQQPGYPPQQPGYPPPGNPPPR